MSTLTGIEAAVDSLPPAEQQELLFYDLPVLTPGMFLHRERAAGHLPTPPG